jgi:hypothetical protein
MNDSKLFASDPRDFALELVSEGYATADHLLLCCLKYMSTDDVRDMLDTNELSPRFNEDNDEDEQKGWLEQFDDHDLEAMLTDIANGNLEIGDDEAADRYRHENIISESITNGNFTQAKEQCTRYGYDYDEMRRIHG